MARSKIRKLPMYPFLLSAGERVVTVLKTPDEPVKKLEDYPVNKLAKELHPNKQYLIVRDIIDVADDVKTFDLTPDRRAGTESLAWFSAGSYLSLHFYWDEKVRFTRPYSLSSSPRESLSYHYKITVKRTEGGIASNYMLDNWKIGTKVLASAPLGDFTYEPLRDAKTIVGIAGGSGITPFYSLAQAIADGDEDCSLILLYGSRTKKAAFFTKEIQDIAKRCDKVRLVNVLSNSKAKGCETGFITAELIKKYAPADEPYSVFLCGPQAMYDFVDKEIEKLGLKPKYVRHELFGEYFHPEQNEDYTGNIDATFNVTVKMANRTYECKCPANTSLLRAMEASGITAPNQCRSGTCGWCHAQLISGEVYVPESADGRRMADKEYGYIHPCISFPLSDVVLDVPPAK